MKRTLPALLIAACVVLAAAGTYAALQPQRGEAPASTGTGPAQSIEIDIPGEQQALVKRGLRFDIGYFANESAATPVASYSIAGHEATVVRPGVVRLPLRKWSTDAASMIVRVRTVTAGGESPWSPPSAIVTAQDVASLQPIPAAGAEPAPAGKAAKAGGEGKKVEGKKEEGKKKVKEPKPEGAEPGPRASARMEKAQRQLSTHPGIKEALEKEFPKVQIVEGLDGYQNLTNYISALYASQNLNIPLAELKPYTSGRKSDLQSGIAKLKPEVDAAAESLKATRSARQLVKNTRKPAKEKAQNKTPDKGR